MVERLQKCLQRHTVALIRLRNVTAEELEDSYKTLSKGYEQLRDEYVSVAQSYLLVIVGSCFITEHCGPNLLQQYFIVCECVI